MTQQWYYRMFGQEFGPVAFEELKQLADMGSINADDEVRESTSSTWGAARSVSGLGLVTTSAPAQPTSSSDSLQSSSTGANDWYCNLHGQELGPISFDELVAFAEQGQLDADVNVKLGASGKWRRVGSIGRLVAVLPFQEPPATEPERPAVASATLAPPNPARSVNSMSPNSSVAPASTSSEVEATKTAVIQAKSGLEAVEQTAKLLVSWALDPSVDPSWWSWLGGVEYGPVGFAQIYEWALQGRIQTTDFLKNGLYGQYRPASGVPGLVSAVAMVNQARESLRAAEAAASEAESKPAVQPVAVAVAAAPITTAAVKSAPVEPKAATVPPPKVEATSVVSPVPEARKTEPSPEPRPSAPPLTAPPSVSTAPRPTTPAWTPPKKSSASMPEFSGEAILNLLKGPIVIGAIVLVVVVAIGYFALPPNHTEDIVRYNDLKKLLDDVRATRAGSKDFAALKSRAASLSTAITTALRAQASNDRPIKQALFWAARTDLPQMMEGDLTKESAGEKRFESHLNDAARLMGIATPSTK